VRLELARTARDAAGSELATALERTGRSLDDVRALLARDDTWIAEASSRIDARTRAVEGTRTVLCEREARLARHDAQPSPATPEREIGAALEEATAAHEAKLHERAELSARLRTDDEARRARAERAAQIDTQRTIAARWDRMNELIGAADGKKFRKFAQSLTFDTLLEQANHHLHELARRYSLARAPGSELELQIVDHDLGDDVRPTTSLSGGESFLVSLGLALGLSSLGPQQARVETLFIDEGFGTLDRDTLDVAIATLEALQSSGRQVGIISHVGGLAERLGARIELRRKGPGRSTVHVARG
jgi:exonuclease SbcC